MAKKKIVEVNKFGGIDDFGKVTEMNAKDAPVAHVNYDVKNLEVQSETHLEDDAGFGGAAIIRMFKFGINPQAFHERLPTKQDLFNAHYKGIETMLWRDGMKVMPDVEPKVLVDSNEMTYTIFVGAAPMKGHLLKEKPQTLSEIAHG